MPLAAYPSSTETRARSRCSVGNSTGNGRRSVWPPESASAVMSSAMGTIFAHSACSAVSQPASTHWATNLAGGGRMKGSATSARLTFANTEFGQ